MKLKEVGRDGFKIRGVQGTFLFSGRGTSLGMDDTVFYVVNGKQYTRKFVKPKNPKTKEQVELRKLFAEAIEQWRVLLLEKRREYNRRAERSHMNGFNLFISEFIKNRKEAPGY